MELIIKMCTASFIIQVANIFISTAAIAQINIHKPPITFNAIDNWPYLHSASINDVGTYIGYMQSTRSDYKATLTLKSIDNRWVREYSNTIKYGFISSNLVVSLNYKQQLIILNLDTDKSRSIAGVVNFDIFNLKGREWLLYIDSAQTLNLTNLNSQKYSYNNVLLYRISRDCKDLVLVTAEKYKKRLSIIKVDNQNETFVCEAENIEDFVFTDDLSNFAFTEQDSNQNKTIQCCSLHKGRLIIVNSYKPTDSDSGFIIQSIDRFSNDGNKLFIRLQGKEIYKHLNDPVMVDIWSTKDDKLQSQQLNELGTNNYAAVLDLKTNAIKRLQLENEEISFIDDDLFTLRIQEGYTGERNWNKSARGQNYLASIKTGEKKLLSFRPLSVSPDSKFMICVDTNSMFVNLVSYNIATGETTQLTENLLPQMKSIGDYNIDDKRRMNFYGWLDIGHTLLFTDDFDFWKVDLDKPQHIINLTDGYGRRNQTILRPIIRNAKIRKDDIELFNAFDINTKKNGFLKFHKGGGANPVILTMSDCYYNIDLLSLPDYFPIKAKHANTWIVQKMTCDSPENYLITKDFKIFQALTDFHPQKDYNWMKSELINFTALDGRKLQGILYKPEDFDSTKKYAVIINFYEQLSHQLHIFHDPDYSIDNINIPYFVSHGYLVFTPDIYFEKGKALEDAYNSVIGSASYLSRLNFVDSMKIAIQGHSFGGSETNYIITKPNKFAAAMSAAGTINLISTAGSVSRNGTPYGREYAELAQGRIGYSLWECPDLYINNSPIFNVDKINLPVLLMYNKDDNAVNFAQGIEFFTALRRLGKTAWMLQYDGEGHSLIEKKNRMDYTNRLLQFFNHYLKGEPMPQWMESGIPAKFKGYTKGY